MNTPERPSKNPNFPKVNYETLLHSAAKGPDDLAVKYLLERGADTTLLNAAKLTPFQQSVLSGNVAAAKYFLSRQGKLSEGCHPSKAAADGRTPLQLAIASGNHDMVKLLLKDATVHDAQKCFQQSYDEEIRNILANKKGFVDPDVQAA